MRKFGVIAASAALLFAAGQASATVLTFDDLTSSPSDPQYPVANSGPIGFVEDGYQFGGNSVALNVAGVANGPAHSGNYVAFPDFAGQGDYTGYGAFDTTITRADGGTFSFVDVYLQSFGHFAGPASDVTGGIFAFDAQGNYVGILPSFTAGGWTHVSATDPGSVLSFTNITTLVIHSTGYIEIDDLQLNATGAVSPLPEASTWGTMVLGFAGIGTLLRRKRAVMAAA